MSLLPLVALAAATAVPGASAPAPRAGEPAVVRHVAEDDHVRIEELRVRGETRRLVVRPKAPGAKEYEIVPVGGGTDPSQGRRSSAGERVWRLFSF